MESNVLGDPKQSEPNISLTQEQKEKQIKQEKLQEQISNQNKNYLFSSALKNNCVTLQNNNTKAMVVGIGELMALVDGVVFEKGSSIKFRILSIGRGSIYVGLGLMNIIAENKYWRLSPNKQGSKIHGCFLLQNNGCAWSHSNMDDNKLKTDFTYDEEDVIEVTTNGDELCFTSFFGETKKKQFRLGLKLTEEEWKEVRFCVGLGSLDSAAVKIVKY